MNTTSHDHNFKNLFQDFPQEALDWILPDVRQKLGQILKVEFVRQEPKKQKLTDSGFDLDMPILFSFEQQKVLLWLVEFQENKSRFSIYKLLRYATDLLEAHEDAILIPTVLFTDRKKWKKDVAQKLESEFMGRLYLHFEYLFVKLYNYEARDYYDSTNPLMRILLPKMNYTPEERETVIIHAYTGLFQLASRILFDKYIDFIDIYAEIRTEEREQLYENLEQRKETVMLAQYIRNKGFEDGIQKGEMSILQLQLNQRFGQLPEWLQKKVEEANKKDLELWARRILSAKTLQEVFE